MTFASDLVVLLAYVMRITGYLTSDAIEISSYAMISFSSESLQKKGDLPLTPICQGQVAGKQP